MKCSVCGKVLFAGRAVIRCSCGVYVHSGCWNSHVVEAHQPSFVIGTITLDGEFEPRKSEPAQLTEEIDAEKEETETDELGQSSQEEVTGE